MDVGAPHPAQSGPELPQQCFAWLCQHRDVTHPGDKGAALAGAVLQGSQAIPVAARRVLAFSVPKAGHQAGRVVAW